MEIPEAQHPEVHEREAPEGAAEPASGGTAQAASEAHPEPVLPDELAEDDLVEDELLESPPAEPALPQIDATAETAPNTSPDAPVPPVTANETVLRVDTQDQESRLESSEPEALPAEIISQHSPEGLPEPVLPDELAEDELLESPPLDAGLLESAGDPAPEIPLPEATAQEDFFELEEPPVVTMPLADAELKAVLEAIIYVTDEPLTLDHICAGLEQPRERIIDLLEQLAADYEQPSRGLAIKEIAGGFKMSTKPEHHEAVRRFVKNLNPPLKLSLPALETLAVIAYKQPITAPEIMEIRGVQGAGVLKTLIDRKLIATAGRKQVVGKPILYKTTREFLVQFGLKDVSELPTLKEFQELGRLDTEAEPPAETQHTPQPSEPLLFPAQPHEMPEPAEVLPAEPQQSQETVKEEEVQ